MHTSQVAQATKILIVEDEQIISWHIQEVLEKEGYEVIAVVGSGIEAIEVVSKIKPDLALMDIRLNGELDGIDTADFLYSTFNIPVVYLTAHCDRSTLARATQSAPFGYLLKPFQPPELHIAIQVALQRHQREIQTIESQKFLIAENSDLSQAIVSANELLKARTEFLANMSHKLRTPLNAINSISGLLQHSTSLDQGNCQDLSMINFSSQHLLAMTNDILEIAKIETEKIELPLNIFALPEFLKGISAIFAIHALQKKITFTTKFDSNLPKFILASEKQLRQVLLNLLGNAFKYTNQGSIKFVVKINKDKQKNASLESISFAIEDTGLGIATPDLKRIFLPFIQAGETKLMFEGSGLGLTISQKTVELMGGEIKVESQLSEGSIFSFNLDLVEASTAVPTFTNQDSRQSYPNLAQDCPLRILLAEDNLINQKLTQKLLQYLGYEIDIVSNGQEVLDRLQNHSYDLILMDIEMPQMDGIETTKKIIENWDQGLSSDYPNIIALTAIPANLEEYMTLGMCDYISKPIQLEVLVQALRRIYFYQGIV